MVDARLLLFQQHCPFFANKWLQRFGKHRQEPGKKDFEPDVVLGDVDGTLYILPERADAELQAIAVPSLLVDAEQMAEIRTPAAEVAFQAAKRFGFAEAMRNGHDQRR